METNNRYTFRIVQNEHGAILMMLLVMVVVTGLAAGIAGSSWKTIAQQAREKELLFRGDQYRRAIGSYYTSGHAGVQGLYPPRLEDLLKDPRSLETLRHIRTLYKDPMTGGDWVLIKDPADRIKGVRSSSTLEPFKKEGFSKENRNLTGADKYSLWEFVYTPSRGSSPSVSRKNQTVSQTPAENM